MTVKTTSDKKVSRQTDEPTGNTGSEENEIRAKEQVEKDEDSIVFDRDALDGQEAAR